MPSNYALVVLYMGDSKPHFGVRSYFCLIKIYKKKQTLNKGKPDYFAKTTLVK